MAQDELTPEGGLEEVVNHAEPAETAEMAAETPMEDTRSAREIANDVFRTRSFEGETLRMGQVLRRVREALGYDVADVSRQTLLRKDYLVWIERMEVGELPGGGYLTAILNTYSKFLGLPEKEVLTAYSHECGAVEDVKKSAPVPKIGEIAPEKSKWPLALAAAAVLVVLGAGAVGVSQMVQPEPELAPAPAVVAVNGGRESLFAGATMDKHPVADNLPLELRAVRQGWLEVRGADGTIFRSRVMAAGESYFPRLEAGWTVSARDGGAFEWRVGDVSVAPLGPDNVPVFSISVDEQLSRAAEASSPAMAANGGNRATR